MFVCVCVCVCVCVYLYTYVCSCVFLYVFMCVLCVWGCVCVYVCVCVCVCVCVYVCLCLCVCVCVCVCVLYLTVSGLSCVMLVFLYWTSGPVLSLNTQACTKPCESAFHHLYITCCSFGVLLSVSILFEINTSTFLWFCVFLLILLPS